MDVNCDEAAEVFVAKEDQLLVDVFRRLASQRSQGCPVVDVHGEYVDQIDALELVFFVCELFRAGTNSPHLLVFSCRVPNSTAC